MSLKSAPINYSGPEIDCILKKFPLTTAGFRRALEDSIGQVRGNFKAVQERLVIQTLPEKHQVEYATLRRKHADLRSQLFFQLAMGLVGTCDKCGVTTSFRCSWNEWQSFCSNTCSNDHVMSTRKQTLMERHGVDNVAKLASVRKKLSKFMPGVKNRILDITIPNAPTPPRGMRFCAYALLDQSTGPSVYGRYRFQHTPLYAGKGGAARIIDHYKAAHRNSARGRAPGLYERIYALAKKHGEFPPYVVFWFKTEIEAFEAERELIATIGRLNNRTGPLFNAEPGGYGGVRGTRMSDARKRELSDQLQQHLSQIRRSTKCPQ